MATGFLVASTGVDGTLAETWNRSRWRNLNGVPDEGTVDNDISGVSCVSPTWCVAVGSWVDNDVGKRSGTRRTLILTWNGSSWAQAASPNPGTTSDTLSGVSCASTSSCVAVGSSANATGPSQALIAAWNGTSWTSQTSPSPGTVRNGLAGVSCVANGTMFCVAVGSSSNGSTSSQTLITMWDGTAWTSEKSPNPGTATNALAGVSCVSAVACTGVGSWANTANPTETLITVWDGSSWTTATSDNPGSGSNTLTGVSCTAGVTTTCTAVGSATNSTGQGQTLMESSNGGSWTAATGPNRGSAANLLTGVSCWSATSCTAVGRWRDTSGSTQILVVAWNGSTWSAPTAPAPAFGQDQLAAVACLSTNACTAVGQWTSSDSITHNLIETSNGEAWTVSPSPNLGSGSNTATGISCPTTDACTAVGFYSVKPGVPHTLVLSWTGSDWSIVPSPNAGSGKAELLGVSCVSPTSCIAVGYDVDRAGIEHALMEWWNGTTWAVMPAPSTGTGSSLLSAISCTPLAGGGAWCAAVGHLFTAAGTERTLIETGSGHQWVIASSLSPGPAVNELDGVSCPTTAFCAAVGSYLTASYVRQTLVESWSGSGWSVVPSPNQGAGANSLASVSCPSTTACMAVGAGSLPASFSEKTLAEFWNGTGWVITATPSPAEAESDLGGVACSTPVTCTGVGHSFVTSDGGNVIEEYA